eukprot:m.342008 g.342008  ORF g.342008 m.342008 type:complete len:161 (-) comp19837_c0_seq1:49-531(-)
MAGFLGQLMGATRGLAFGALGGAAVVYGITTVALHNHDSAQGLINELQAVVRARQSTATKADATSTVSSSSSTSSPPPSGPQEQVGMLWRSSPTEWAKSKWNGLVGSLGQQLVDNTVQTNERGKEQLTIPFPETLQTALKAVVAPAAPPAGQQQQQEAKQ